jgi:hypothetical protein
VVKGSRSEQLGSRDQGVKGATVQGLKGSWGQRFKGSRGQGVKGSRGQGGQGSRGPGDQWGKRLGVKGQGVKRSRARSSQGVKRSRGQGVMGSRGQGAEEATGQGQWNQGFMGAICQAQNRILRILIRYFSSKQNGVFVMVQKGIQKPPTRQTGLPPQIKSNTCNRADMPRSQQFTNHNITFLRISILLFKFSSKQNGVFMRVEGGQNATERRTQLSPPRKRDRCHQENKSEQRR